VQTVLLTLRYHGAAFAGWQRQDGFDTVQARVEAALSTLFGEHLDVHGAGRTDAGVHALGQCAHARLPAGAARWEPTRLRAALNGNLPAAVAVVGVREVPHSFHARFSAAGKRYLYRMVVGRVRPVHGRDLVHWVRRPLKLDAMRRAARHIVGRKDFAAFANNPGYERTRGTVRTVRHLHLLQRPWGLDLVIQGDGFLYNQVRNIAGTLIDVGTGRTTADGVAEILAAADRRRAGPTAPAQGLYMARVLYPKEVLELKVAGGDASGKLGSIPAIATSRSRAGGSPRDPSKNG